MGLLDAVLGNVLGGGGQAGQGRGGSAMLMQIVAAMLANRGGGAGGGGLGSVLGSALGGGAGASSGMGGGLGGLLEQLQRAGLGEQVNSWIGTGPNEPVSPEQVGGVLGDDMLGEMQQRTGMDRGDILGQLSQMLPQMVDRSTPEGRVPDGGFGDIGAILERFGGTPR
jgi:uncharacterized protein YidB (DUF937 family)